MAGKKMMKLKVSKLFHVSSLLNRCNLWEKSFSGVDFLTSKLAKMLNYIACISNGQNSTGKHT